MLRATPSKIDIEFTAGSQKPGLMGENTSLQPVDTAKNPVIRKLGLKPRPFRTALFPKSSKSFPN
ncbi:hypothetical protein, partial [Microcoleus sp. AR_TQ3_B6]|uniref:hypothetical protein n=1 Tax=Microcoleus sp. AR_TQ3_B6 TaxID=3055284 RepID=UPI002FD516F5